MILKNKKIKGFTLVELLAVIVILAVILVIAVPQIMSVIDDSKIASLESTAKMIASQAEKTMVQNQVLGNNKEITCEDIAKINDVDYEYCSIEFDGNKANVTINGSGKFEGLNVCNGTKTEATARNTECPISYGDADTYITKLYSKESTLNNGLVQTTATVSGETVDAGIRYAGATSNVKNKVYFNCAETDGTNEYGSENYKYDEACEIWRIIGVFDTKSTDSETEKSVRRIKIVRDQVLDEQMPWDTPNDGVSGINQWGETTLISENTTVYSGASLMQYLNYGEESYYNNLTSIAKKQMSDALWYVGAVAKNSASGVYEDERSDTSGTGTSVNYTTNWVGKIGLIYASDFGYAGTNCGSYTIYDYNKADSCGKNSNWLTPVSGYYWTISPYASSKEYVWLVHSVGCAYNVTNVPGSGGVRPTLYLAHNVKITGGNGDNEPYILGL